MLLIYHNYKTHKGAYSPSNTLATGQNTTASWRRLLNGQAPLTSYSENVKNSLFCILQALTHTNVRGLPKTIFSLKFEKLQKDIGFNVMFKRLHVETFYTFDRHKGTLVKKNRVYSPDCAESIDVSQIVCSVSGENIECTINRLFIKM